MKNTLVNLLAKNRYYNTLKNLKIILIFGFCLIHAYTLRISRSRLGARVVSPVSVRAIACN